MPKAIVATPKTLQPFTSHGVHLDTRDGVQYTGDCPLCGGESKFSVEVETSKYRCWSCNESGNSTEFLRKLHAISLEQTTEDQYAELAADRKVLSTQTLRAWGLAVSVLTDEWLVPGYNADGNLCNLHRYRDDAKSGKRVLHATGGPGLQMFGVPLLLEEHTEVWVVESWNALALWETLGLAGVKDVGVVGVPGCNVFQEGWSRLFANRRVVVGYDNDYPRQNRVTGAEIPPAGHEGCKRTTRILNACETPPESVSWLAWGPDGYDSEIENKYDVRDMLTESVSVSARVKAMEELRSKVQPTPEEWSDGVAARTMKATGHAHLTPMKCTGWLQLLNAIRQAIRSRPEIEGVFATMLAVAASTSQVGDQIFLMVLADPGSSKSRLCDAMLVSQNCFALEDFTSFYSGATDKEGNSYSLIDRINHKTLITPEGDIIMSSLSHDVIMSQQRRIYDGGGGKTYGNQKEDVRHTGLRTPWILAGTPAMMDKGQARLGDRFIRARINQPDSDEKRKILQSVGYSALRSVLQTSNGDATKSIEENMRVFYQLTGGYVDYLRANMERLVATIQMDDAALIEECSDLAEFTAMFRSRPAPTRKDGGETHDSTEMPTRLTHQFVRLACCLAVALVKKEGDTPVIDDEVMRIVRQRAIDTCEGRTLNIARYLMKEEVNVHEMWVGGQHGRFVTDVGLSVNMTAETCKPLLQFMKTIQITESFKTVTNPNQGRWRLTKKATDLYNKVMNS